MQFLENLALQPTADHILLIKIILVLVYSIHLPYISIIFGSAVFSVVFFILNEREPNEIHRFFAKDAIRWATSNKASFFLLGVFPLITVLFVYAQLYQNANFPIVNWLAFVLLFLSLGYVILTVYNHFFSLKIPVWMHLGAGISGVGSFTMALLYLISSLTLVYSPDKWRFVNPLLPFFADVNMLPRYLLFFVIIFMVFSGAVYFFFLAWQKKSAKLNDNYAVFIKQFSTALVLIMVLIQPFLLIWTYYTFPNVSKTADVILFGFINVFLLFLIAVFVYSALQSNKPKYAATIFVGILFTVVFYNIGDQVAATFAYTFQEKKLALQEKELREKILAGREEKKAELADVDGGEIFNSKCITCHRYDTRLVGPPLNSVLIKYKNEQEELISFILNPKKINPDYPPMPDPGLNRAEAKAVAEHVLGNIQ